MIKAVYTLFQEMFVLCKIFHRFIGIYEKESSRNNIQLGWSDALHYIMSCTTFKYNYPTRRVGLRCLSFYDDCCDDIT